MNRIFSAVVFAAIALLCGVNCAELTVGPSPQMVKMGESAEFTCAVEGYTEGLEYRRWFRDGVLLWEQTPLDEAGDFKDPSFATEYRLESSVNEGTQYQTLTVLKVEAKHRGTYKCEIIFGRQEKTAALYTYDCAQNPAEALKMGETGTMECTVASSDATSELPSLDWDGGESVDTGRAVFPFTASTKMLGKTATCFVRLGDLEKKCSVDYDIEVPFKVEQIYVTPKIIKSLEGHNVLEATANKVVLTCVVVPETAKADSFDWTVNNMPVTDKKEMTLDIPLQSGPYAKVKEFVVKCKANPGPFVSNIPDKDLTKEVEFARYEPINPDSDDTTGGSSTVLPHLTVLASVMILLRLLF